MSFPISFWCDSLVSTSYGQSQTLANSFEFCATSWPDLKRISCDGFHVLNGNGSRFSLPFWKLVDSFQDPQRQTSGSVIFNGKRSPCFSISHVTLLKAGCCDQINMRCFTWFCFWFVFLPDIKVTCPENGKLHQCIVVNLLKFANQIKQMRCIIAVQCFCSQFSSPVRHGRHGPLEQSSQVLSRSFTSQLPTAFRRYFVLCSRRCGELLRWCIGG